MGIRLRLPGLVDHVPDTWNDRQLADAGQLMDPPAGAAAQLEGRRGVFRNFKGGHLMQLHFAPRNLVHLGTKYVHAYIHIFTARFMIPARNELVSHLTFPMEQGNWDTKEIHMTMRRCCR